LPKPSSSELAAGSREHNASSKERRLDLFRFVPFRLNRLAAEVSAALASEYQERYGLDIPEWRVLATLGFRNDACSAQYIADCTRTHKSTISRAVTAFPEAEAIFEANIATLRRLGAEGWAALQARCREDAALVPGRPDE